jgi:SAM-dependent methyltransferase
MVLLSCSDQLSSAWADVHRRLVRRIVAALPTGVGSLLEVGCGRGQITVPLAQSLPATTITALDRFRGAYAHDRPTLRAGLVQAGAERHVRVVRADALRWIAAHPAGRFQVVLSNEFLPELDSSRMRAFFGLCYRVLAPGGVTVHTYLSPDPRNLRQELVIEADSDPRWTRHPPREWFSPPADLAVRELRVAGFRRARVEPAGRGFAARGEAARALLRRWGVRASFVRTYAGRLRSVGLELPDWVAVLGVKPP